MGRAGLRGKHILNRSLGHGIGIGPYCGHGRATGIIPTEDLMNMLEEMGIDTDVDLDKLIDCVWMAEEILGCSLMGHVSKNGLSLPSFKELFDPNMPFVETLSRPATSSWVPVPKGGIYPWREPISCPYWDRLKQGLPAYEIDGDWP